MKFEKAPKIIFKADAFEKMMEYARAASGEISGFSTVEEKGDIYYITETYIMPQKASGGGVLINAETLHDFMVWCKTSGYPERAAKARLWWHSHANFGVFRSSTDTGTVALLRQVMPYLICMVVNKRREYELTLYERTFTLTGMKAIKEDPKSVMRSAIEAEVEELVKPWDYGTSEHLVADTETAPSFTRGMTAEDIYLLGLEKPTKEMGPSPDTEVRRSETPWQRYLKQKQYEQELRNKPVHAMTPQEFDDYCRLYDAEPLVGAVDKPENDDDTKRFICEEGQVRPDPKERE